MKLPVPLAAGLVAILGVILFIVGLTGHNVRFEVWGAALAVAALVAFVGAATARTTRPGEVQPGVAFEGMPWWSLAVIGILIVAGGVIGAVVGA